jgi:hypothetical protein
MVRRASTFDMDLILKLKNENMEVHIIESFPQALLENGGK